MAHHDPLHDDPERGEGAGAPAAAPQGTLTASFEITGWEPSTYEERDGRILGRVTVRKTFNGDLHGASTAELLTAEAPGGRGYVASERFSGSIAGRTGTVVFQHGGLDDGVSPTAFGAIVPGSGTGELEALAGTITYRHDDAGARVVLDLGGRR